MSYIHQRVSFHQHPPKADQPDSGADTVTYSCSTLSGSGVMHEREIFVLQGFKLFLHYPLLPCEKQHKGSARTNTEGL